MRAVQFSEYGGPEVLSVAEVPTPEPGPGQVRIEVEAAGVNPIDWKTRSGYRPVEFPAGLGSDLSGVVDAVGPGVTGLTVGDEVFGWSSSPSYAEYALAEPASIVRKPASVDWKVAAGIGVAGRTAVRCLRELHVTAEDTLLVTAAAGGVGVFAVQLARRTGARVIGTAGPANLGFLKTLGAEGIEYGDGFADRIRAIASAGVDAVLDASGRGELPALIDLAGGGERVVSVADPKAAEKGARFGSAADSSVDVSDALSLLAELLEREELEVPIWRTFPLAQVQAAHRESEAGHLRGKIILVP